MPYRVARARSYQMTGDGSLWNQRAERRPPDPTDRRPPGRQRMAADPWSD
jgi:hypothetical protein